MEKVIEDTSPKIFISYSWTTPEHEVWVEKLATRLVEDGVNVILDKWDLKEGHDIYSFMETMGTDQSLKRVLIICDKGYKEKADKREGGVGVESQIITPNIYKDSYQEKFIPIIAERDENNQHFVPSYMQSRMYLDLASPNEFEENYEKLLRNIYDKPMYQKPKLGKKPGFLLDEDIPRHTTIAVLRKMRESVEKYPHKFILLWEDYQFELSNTINNYRFEIEDSEKLDEKIQEKIEQLISLRNEYIEVLEMLIAANNLNEDSLIELFENIYLLAHDNKMNKYEDQSDHLKYFVWEIFLYTITVLLKFRKYEVLKGLINNEYDLRNYMGESSNFTVLRSNLNSLRRLTELRGMDSFQAHLLHKYKHSKYGDLVFEADIILFYIYKINPVFQDNYQLWFPVSYVYLNKYKRIKFLSNLSSRKHFEKVKDIFGVSTKDHFIQRAEQIEYINGYFSSFETIPKIDKYIVLKEICSKS